MEHPHVYERLVRAARAREFVHSGERLEERLTR
jgi:hypothetical protein